MMPDTSLALPARPDGRAGRALHRVHGIVRSTGGDRWAVAEVLVDPAPWPSGGCVMPDMPRSPRLMSGWADVRECRSCGSFSGISDPVEVAGQVVKRPLGGEGADENLGERAVL